MKKSNISLFTAGSILSALLGFSAILIAARYSKSGSIGEYSLYQASLSFSLIFIGLSIEQSILRRFHEEKNVDLLLKSSLVPGVVVGFLLVCLQIMIPTIYSSIILKKSSTELSVLICISLIINYLVSYLCVITRLVEKGGLYALGVVLPKLGFLIFLLVTIWNGKLFDTTRMVVGSIAGMCLALLCFMYGLKNTLSKLMRSSIDYRMVVESLRYAVPLCITGLLFSALTYLDRFILNSLSSNYELDLYAVSVSMAGFATIFQAAFATVWAPIFYKWLNRKGPLDEMQVVANVVVFVIVSIWTILGVFGWILHYALPANYQKSTELLLCCVAFPLFYTVTEITGIGINVVKRTMIQLWVTIGLICLNGCLSFLLIPRLGAQGAAISSSISFYMYFIAKSELSNKIWYKFDNIKIYIFLTLFCILSILLNSNLINYVQSQVLFVILFIIYLMFNAIELKSSLAKIKLYMSK